MKHITKKSSKKSTSKTAAELIFGLFRPGTKAARMLQALKSGPKKLEQLMKIEGSKKLAHTRARVYGLGRLGSKATPKFKMSVSEGVARLLLGKKKAA